MTATIMTWVLAVAAVSGVLGLRAGVGLARRWSRRALQDHDAAVLAEFTRRMRDHRVRSVDLDRRVADAEQQRVDAAEIRATAEKLGPRIREAGRG
ncbi:hypothetical protein QRX60_16935 [Amycolatopsis mongoliensis]|uniref:Uncharacterized protein n=1 Tax=Amycolatopsis mongoliensis TaxID=715475 RepID=A0A9Y2NKV4_9PSEU|nr:hypothetical protein [Amycolatopsis sp. 4-36]WIY05444.1 hypothetical protein QRX60_16935 [Amycolatopsis sp. 4-36]